jgi:putative ABC transport system permease protein
MVDPGLLIALDAQVGDTLLVGFSRFEIRASLTSIPGDPGIAATIGPRVYIPERFVAETQLLGLGSRAEFEAVIRLGRTVDARAWLRPLEEQMRARNVRTRTVDQSERNLSDAIDQLARFLSVVGLIALLLGGIGVASGVNAFVQRKIDTVAVLRCLGASGAQVLTIYLLQAAAMGFIGAAVGAALGVGIQFAMARVLSDFLPVDVAISVVPSAIALGLAVGVWVAVGVARRPLPGQRRGAPRPANPRGDDA